MEPELAEALRQIGAVLQSVGSWKPGQFDINKPASVRFCAVAGMLAEEATSIGKNDAPRKFFRSDDV